MMGCNHEALSFSNYRKRRVRADSLAVRFPPLATRYCVQDQPDCLFPKLRGVRV